MLSFTIINQFLLFFVPRIMSAPSDSSVWMTLNVWPAACFILRQRPWIPRTWTETHQTDGKTQAPLDSPYHIHGLKRPGQGVECTSNGLLGREKKSQTSPLHHRLGFSDIQEAAMLTIAFPSEETGGAFSATL